MTMMTMSGLVSSFLVWYLLSYAIALPVICILVSLGFQFVKNEEFFLLIWPLIRTCLSSHPEW